MNDPSFELILLRHGQTTQPERLTGRSDAPLSATGLAQMQAARAQLGELHSIAASTLQRCALPAGDWAQQAGLTAHLDPRLAEYDFGDWEGRLLTELEQDEPGWQQRLWHTEQPPPGAETRQAFEQRVLTAFADWLTVSQGQRRLLVAHGGVIAVLLAHLLGIPAEAARRIGVMRGGYVRLAMLPPQPAWLTALVNPGYSNQ